MKKVIAAAIQYNIILGEIDANLDKVGEALRRISSQGAQLAVLPEMWACGYDYSRIKDLAEQTPRVLAEIQEVCEKLELVTVGSLPELDDGKIYNTAYVVDCGKVVGRYRKLHLFSALREDLFLAAGQDSLVVDTSVGRLGVAICYDLRFPELFRKLALDGAEIICLPAEWPKPRHEHWQILTRARAIENQLFVVATNCCGVQGKLDFFGMSQIVSPTGKVLEVAGEEDTELIASCDFSEMASYREKIHILGDRRGDVYGIP